VYDGTVFALDEHIDRLLDSAKVLLSPSPAPPRLSTRP
jgi:branched-subunit amino acid aminotransferase/4-amino-4-deoxychorismate lyase